MTICLTVETCFSLLQQNYCNLALGEWILLKQQVASFFLESNIQYMDGTLVLNHKGRVCWLRDDRAWHNFLL